MVNGKVGHLGLSVVCHAVMEHQPESVYAISLFMEVTTVLGSAKKQNTAKSKNVQVSMLMV